MKSVGARFLIPFGLLAVLVSTLVFYQTYEASRKHATELISKQAAMALEFNLAIRDYAAEKIRPVMERLAGKDAFMPQTMSTSFISSEIFEVVRKKFPDFVIRFSSDNPRNPANIANQDELQMLEYFRRNPEIERLTKEILIDGKRYLALFTPKLMKPECLHCHGDPKDAPAELVERYGATASFHRKLGDVAALDTVAVPVDAMNASLASEMRLQTMILALAFAALFGSILVVFRFVVTRRLNAMAMHFNEIAAHPVSPSMREIDVRGNDEISALGTAFNKLVEHLRAAHAFLEFRVNERTDELRRTNEQLQSELAEHKRAEEELRESGEQLRRERALLRTLIDSVQDLIFFKDKDSVYLGCNKAFEVYSGMPESMLIGRTDLELAPREIAEFYRRTDREVFSSGRARRNEEWIPFKDGGGAYFDMLKTAYYSTDGELLGLIGVGRDISGRKQAENERRKLEERLQRAEKMEALGTMAGGVAHDLNNVLGIVVGYSELLLRDLNESGSARSKASEILKGGQRAAAIVQDLLTLARRGVLCRQVLNLNTIIMDCQNSPEFANAVSYNSNIEIKTALSPDILNVSGSSVHLGKSFMNLVSNAAEAMPNGGTLTIKTANHYLDKPISGYDEVQEGDYVVLSITDTGEGIPASDLKRIFEPFYTKKVMGRSGTGLGLAVVWGTVKDHLGYINVESEEGKGTTFTLYFPVAREEITRDKAPLSVAEYTGNGECILVVDDVQQQRELAESMLKKLNYKVTTVCSGEEAVEYLKQNPADLVVLDMIMDPGMDGLDTYAKILEILSHQKAIIVSGFSETERVRRAQELGAGAYVKKPYMLEQLGLAVRRELDRPHVLHAAKE
ncbi:MAG: DUF3365 domain-containing protein [Syntrophobacteraceae bacterium]